MTRRPPSETKRRSPSPEPTGDRVRVQPAHQRRLAARLGGLHAPRFLDVTGRGSARDAGRNLGCGRSSWRHASIPYLVIDDVARHRPLDVWSARTCRKAESLVAAGNAEDPRGREAPRVCCTACRSVSPAARGSTSLSPAPADGQRRPPPMTPLRMLIPLKWLPLL